jgi:4-hydroxy-tetrahydrodipicolinate synthase
MRFPGVIPAVVTPFDEHGEVDAGALGRNVRSLVEAGVDGLVGTGTMGEAGSLSREERRLVLEAIAEATGDRVPLIAGVSSETPGRSVAYASDAAAAGAAALMLLPPLGYTGDDTEISAFYGAVAAETEVPIMAYNNPSASGGTDMAPGTIASLAEIDGVVAVKECSGDARRIAAILAEGGLEVLVGGDDWALEGFCAGATGWVSGVANVAPRESRELYERCRAGELEAARELNARLLPLARFDMRPKLVQFFKEAMDAAGFEGGRCRAPRLPLTAPERDELVEAMAALRAGAEIPA